jgi:BMFP domain-containing protein YqiC
LLTRQLQIEIEKRDELESRISKLEERLNKLEAVK